MKLFSKENLAFLFVLSACWTHASAFAQPIEEEFDAGNEQSPGNLGDGPVFVSFGDSISTGFNAQHLLDNPKYSWATGSSVTSEFKSQAQHAQELTGTVYTRKNFAVAGSKAVDIKQQVDKLRTAVPEVATLLIGANDVCSWGEDYAEARRNFEADLHLALDALVAKNANIRILMSAIPDMGVLYELGAMHGCQSNWNLTGICSPLLGAERTPSERQAFLARMRALNASLANVAASYPQQVSYHEDVAEMQFEWQHVSRIDCFHPSVAGQGFLSETLWGTGWLSR